VDLFEEVLGELPAIPPETRATAMASIRTTRVFFVPPEQVGGGGAAGCCEALWGGRSFGGVIRGLHNRLPCFLWLHSWESVAAACSCILLPSKQPLPYASSLPLPCPPVPVTPWQEDLVPKSLADLPSPPEPASPAGAAAAAAGAEGQVPAS
jgi:hypothetical protein